MINLLNKNILDSAYKGVPSQVPTLPISKIGNKAWNVLRQDVSFPVALIKQSALNNNRQFMRTFLDEHHISLCPHGKTTMSPQLFQMQMEDGAWGMTVATIRQLLIAKASGCQRVLLANQLIGQQAIQTLFHILNTDLDFDFYCLADSVEAVQQLAQAAKEWKLNRPLQLLLERGIAHGRTGCRQRAQAIAIAKAIQENTPYLSLRGVAGYEGIIHGNNEADTVAKINQFLDELVVTVMACESFFADQEVIVSAGGSAYFDLVVNKLTTIQLAKPTRLVIRSGCYLTHDSAFYQSMFALMQNRNPSLANAKIGLQPALEVWAYVQSLPEPGLAIATIGKRDCSYDIDLPIPRFHCAHQNQQLSVSSLDQRYRVMKLDDQHAYLQVPVEHQLAIGDMLGFGISHPCTTFDKWQMLYVVNDHYDIIDAITTYF